MTRSTRHAQLRQQAPDRLLQLRMESRLDGDKHLGPQLPYPLCGGWMPAIHQQDRRIQPARGLATPPATKK